MTKDQHSQIDSFTRRSRSARYEREVHDFAVRACHGDEVLFELHSRDPRDLIQVLWSRVKGIEGIELIVEKVEGQRRAQIGKLRLERNPYLYDRLFEILRQLERRDFAALN